MSLKAGRQQPSKAFRRLSHCKEPAMPIPFLFIGVAAATGTLGAGKTVKAGVDAAPAKRLNDDANSMVQAGTDTLKPLLDQR